MKRTLPFLVAVAFVSTSGCVLVPVKKVGSSKSAMKSSERPDCAPSQYWDGEVCRHKGKGHGARKHDG